MLKDFPKDSFLLIGSRFIERAMYYGLRSIIVFYAMDRIFVPVDQCLQWFAYFTLITYVSMVVSGILSDLLLKSKLSLLIGGILQVIGTLLLIVPDFTYFKIGGILFSVGSGFSSVNLISSFGRYYFNKWNTIQRAFTLLNIALTAGGFLGAYYMYMFVEDYTYETTFVVIAILFAISTALAYLHSPKNHYPVQKTQNFSAVKSISIIALLILVSTLFWTSIEYSSIFISENAIAASENSSTIIDAKMRTNYETYGNLLFAIPLFFLLNFLRIYNLTKIALGLFLMSIGFLIVIPNLENFDQLHLFLILNILFLSFGEVIITPSITSLWFLYTNPKYITILIGSLFCSTMLISKFVVPLVIDNNNLAPIYALKLYAAILSGMGVLLILVNYFVKETPAYEPIENDTTKDNFELKENDILD